MNTFAARCLTTRNVPGQIGPDGRGILIRAKSLAAAKRAAKSKAEFEEWRLLEVFKLEPGEIETHRKGGFVYEIDAT